MMALGNWTSRISTGVACLFSGMLSLLCCFISAGYVIGRKQSWTLPALLLLFAVLLLAATLMIRLSPRCLIITFDPGSKIILIAGLLLALQLLLRIMNDNIYGGSWSEFDFGCKVDTDAEFDCFWERFGGDCTNLTQSPLNSTARCPGYAAGNSLKGDTKPALGDISNKAFVMEMESWGHMTLGLTACFFFPCWDHILKKWPHVLIFVQILQPPVFVFYPLYNILKRAAHGTKYFSRTSFCNNGSEWSAGFLLGGALGVLLSACCGMIHRESSVHPMLIRWSVWNLRIRLLVSALLVGTWIVAAVLYCVSWDLSRDKKPQVNSGLVILLVVPLLVTAPVAYVVYSRDADAVKQNGGNGGNDGVELEPNKSSSARGGKDGTTPLILSSTFSESYSASAEAKDMMALH